MGTAEEGRMKEDIGDEVYGKREMTTDMTFRWYQLQRQQTRNVCAQNLHCGLMKGPKGLIVLLVGLKDPTKRPQHKHIRCRLQMLRSWVCATQVGCKHTFRRMFAGFKSPWQMRLE